MNELLLIIVAYLLGSIPTSVWVSKHFFNIDIREWGSGNAGAMNTYRVLGTKWGTLVLVVDMMKAIVAVNLAFLLPQPQPFDGLFLTLQITLGLAAVLGHIFPVWANFRGGKGVASIFGMVLGIQPNLAVFGLAFITVVLFLTQWLSFRFITVGIALSITFFLVFFYS